MSSIPPNIPNFSSNNIPSNTNTQPTSSNNTNKEFSLPKKDENTSNKSTDQQKSKGLEKKKDKDSQDPGAIAQNAKTEVSSAEEKENLKVSATEATQKVADVKVLHAVILKNVDAIRVGKDSIEVDLKATANLPAAFQGAQMSLTKTDAGLVIKIDNVSNVSEAQKLLTSNPLATQALANQLAAKGFESAQFQIGNVTVALPPPVKEVSEVANAGQQSFEREGGGQQGGGGGQQDQRDKRDQKQQK